MTFNRPTPNISPFEAVKVAWQAFEAEQSCTGTVVPTC